MTLKTWLVRALRMIGAPHADTKEMLKGPERDSGDASATDVPPPLGFGPAIPLTRPT
jgi:hypothetical protein